MDGRGVVPLGVVVMLVLASCAPHDIQIVWPEPRPLGRDLPSYRPPPQLPEAAPAALVVTNPTGILTLPQAQAQALLQHPRLAAFGWEVRAGEVMAVIDSRELADTKAAYLAARERVSLAEMTFAREKDLWEKKISPAEDYLKAKQALAEVRIEIQVAAQKLRALGFAEAYMQQLAGRANAPLTRYEVVAPFAGTVIEKRHVAVGEVLKDDTEAFVVADLSTVWVDLNISAKDLSLVRKGQRVRVAADTAMRAEGTVSYISPVVSDETRTVLTRVVLPNLDGRWRPGLFVTAMLSANEAPVAVLIPKTATQTIDGQPSVFVQTPEGFAPRPVTMGRANETHVEITAGLEAGERYATTETFLLKAEIGKGTASHQH